NPRDRVSSEGTQSAPSYPAIWRKRPPLNYVWNKIQIKPFISLQQTQLINSSPYLNTENAPADVTNNMDPQRFNINSGLNRTQRDHGSPRLYGGLFFNYSPTSPFNINLNAYFYNSQQFAYFPNFFINDGRSGRGSVNGKVILNTRIAYRPVRSLNVFINLRNWLNNDSPEFYGTDRTPLYLMGGLNFEY
ncbi:MAG: hypothetical protein HC880_13975, partial [Bacteroidia bacterium]|nr:hypothetical protein [Bacteroidia bacterium]